MSRVPKGQGLKDQLRTQLASNPYMELDADQVARRYQVGRSHAIKVLQVLQREGVVERAQVYRVPRAAQGEAVGGRAA